MSHHISIDLETLSTAPDAFIVAIGAARFDPMADGIVDSFYTAVDLNNSAFIAKRFRMDPATIGWWLHSERAAARDALKSGSCVDLLSALEGFGLWVGETPLPVWGNGATFDNVVLTNAYKALGMDVPWTYKDDRCLRTLRALAPDVRVENVGTAHHALDDAVTQALLVQAIVKHLGLEVV